MSILHYLETATWQRAPSGWGVINHVEDDRGTELSAGADEPLALAVLLVVGTGSTKDTAEDTTERRGQFGRPGIERGGARLCQSPAGGPPGPVALPRPIHSGG